MTGMTFYGGKLSHHGQEVNAISLSQALHSLDLFFGDDTVVLAAHNCRVFDARVLVTAIRNSHSLFLLRKIVGFADTLPLAKQLLPNQKKYNQETLFHQIIGENYAAHDALEDVKALKKIVEKLAPSDDILHQNSFSVNFVSDSLDHLKLKKENCDTLVPLTGVLSASMIQKIAASGLNFKHLQIANTRDSERGIYNIFTEKLPNNKLRVTSRKQIIDSVKSFLSGTD